MTEAKSSPGLRILACLRFDPRAAGREIASLKRMLIDDDRTLHSVEVSGAFDFMIEVALPDFPSYQTWTEQYADEFARLTERHETNFVCRRFIRRHGYRHHFWAAAADGLRRVDCDLVNSICAEGDYVRLNAADNSWLLHSSLTKLIEELDPDEFVRLHRSTVVRRGAMVRLIHRGHSWFAVLECGQIYRIARSHIDEVLRTARDHSPTLDTVSATEIPLFEKPIRLIEEVMH